MTKYYTPKETAVIIRSELKKVFPGFTFSVKSGYSTHSGKVDVRWFDGPTETEVRAVIGKFCTSSFDGMTDMSSYHHLEYKGEQCSFVEFLMTTRSLSPAFANEICDHVVANYTVAKRPTIEVSTWDGKETAFFAHDWTNLYSGANGEPAGRLCWQLSQTWSKVNPPAPQQPAEVAPIAPPAPTEPPKPVLTLVIPEPAQSAPIEERLCDICKQPMTSDIVHTDGGKAGQHYEICDTCDRAVTAYQLRVVERYARLTIAAERAERQARAAYDHAHKMAEVIPFGQPILVGHHSEQRDRNYRNRIHNTYGRAFESFAKAEELKRKAEHPSRAISSDDPAAVIKLKEKLAKLEAWQAHMVETNKHVRDVLKMKSPADLESKAHALAARAKIEVGKALKMLKGDFLGRTGYADYELRNNSATIRSIKQRIEELSKKAEALATVDDPVTTEQFGDIKLERDQAENRLRLKFPGKPSSAMIALLKQRGFRWSPSNMAWQRQLNNAAEYQAKFIIEQYTASK